MSPKPRPNSGLNRNFLLVFIVFTCALWLIYMHHDRITYYNPFQSNCKIYKMFEETSMCEPDDFKILEYIRRYHLEPPSTKQLNLTSMHQNMDVNVRATLQEMMDRKEKGFFIECGANNGEYLSQTIDLEINYGWSGLLVEASPSLYAELVTKNRKAWISNTCLSSKRPELLEFLRHSDKKTDWRNGIGRIDPEKYYTEATMERGYDKENFYSEGHVECFPLYSVLKAIDVDTVDFFSLDVEGHEFTILKDIPFDKILIKVIFVEHGAHTQKNKDEIKNLLLKNGYKVAVETNNDWVFTRNET